MDKYNNEQNNFFKNYFRSNELTKSKNKLLSLSLVWMGVGIAVVFMISWAFVAIPTNNFINFLINSSTNSVLMLSLINLILMIGIIFIGKNPKTSLSLMISMYLIFVLFEGLYIGALFTIYNVQINELLPLFLVPTLMFALMGVIGYFNLLDFTKIVPFLFFATIGLSVFSLFLFLLPISNTLFKVYSLVGFIIFTLWIGFDIQMIMKLDKVKTYNNEKDFLKLSVLMGLNLFLDFINLIIMLLRFLRS